MTAINQPSTQPPATTDDQTNSFIELTRIAEEIEKAEPEWAHAWDTLGDHNGLEGQDLINKATLKLNSEIERHVDDIARITRNSTSTIRQSFAPRDWGDVWFSTPSLKSPSKFLHLVAKYQSFNSEYWLSCQRKSAREALFAAVLPESVVSVQAAAQAIKQGGIPHVLAEDVKSLWNQLRPLAVELLAQGILQSYDKSYKDRVSATMDFAFVVHSQDENGIETQEYNFWPKGMAANHIESCVISTEAGDTGVDDVKTEAARRRPRP